nr:DUF5915 domain-containing protein [Psychrobacillus soli]
MKQFTQGGFVKYENGKVELEDVQIEKIAKDGYASASNGEHAVTLNTSLTKELLQEGLARELIRAIQAYRKQLNLPIDLRVDITVKTDKELQTVFENFKRMFEQNLLMRNLVMNENVVRGTEIQIADHIISIQLTPVNR